MAKPLAIYRQFRCLTHETRRDWLSSKRLGDWPITIPTFHECSEHGFFCLEVGYDVFGACACRPGLLCHLKAADS